MDNQVGIYPILHNLCFSFPWVLQPSQEKLKRMLMQNFFFFWGGGGGWRGDKQGALWEMWKWRIR